MPNFVVPLTSVIVRLAVPSALLSNISFGSLCVLYGSTSKPSGLEIDKIPLEVKAFAARLVPGVRLSKFTIGPNEGDGKVGVARKLLPGVPMVSTGAAFSAKAVSNELTRVKESLKFI
jgi:hypothetical protein